MSTTTQSLEIDDYLNPLDEAALRASYRDGQPFRHVVIPQLLRTDFLQEVCAAYPGYAEAKKLANTEFRRVNENLKLQITDAERLPDSIRTLHLILASDEFRSRLEGITGIENLLSDPTLRGAGMHMMGRGGRLDVHVDFNVLRESQLYRRLNILVYLCEDWDPAWGGAVDLWDRDVRELAASHSPEAGRCLIFNTSEYSWHGVTPVRCPPGRTRNSFAAYYYTAEPPTDVGVAHTTVFRPRPGEGWRQKLLLPLQRIGDVITRAVARLRRVLPGN